MVEWLKVKAMSSSLCTAKEMRNGKPNVFAMFFSTTVQNRSANLFRNIQLNPIHYTSEQSFCMMPHPFRHCFFWQYYACTQGIKLAGQVLHQ
jgi:hypothetical protein